MSRLAKLLNEQLDMTELQKHYPTERIITGQGVLPCVIRDGKKMLQFSGLDYLGLATDPRIEEAAIDAIREYGVGALASRLTTGTLDIHRELEKKLAGFMGAEDATVFTSGMMTNLGTVPAVICSSLILLCPGEKAHGARTIFIDELSHASLQDATILARWGKTKKIEYKHCDTNDLRQKVAKFGTDLNLIITDGVFSMDGDVAPLNEIAEIARESGSVIYCDDAHGVGVLGENGRGTCELLSVEDQVDVRMGVISKALGTMGGFIAGDAWFIKYLRHCRTQMFSMGLPAAETAATIKAIEIAQNEPWRRQRVLQSADYLRSNLEALGYNVLNSTSQIVPVLLGEEKFAHKVETELENREILSPILKYPSTPKGMARLRLFPTALHTKEQLDYFLNAMSDIAVSMKTESMFA